MSQEDDDPGVLAEAKRRLEDMPSVRYPATPSASLEDIEAAWIEEAEHRREDLHAGRTTAVPWQEVRRDLFAMCRYDQTMAQAQPAQQIEPEAPFAERLPPETEDAYRARLIAKIERGIADVKAGRPSIS